jgi:cytochrome c peroxidase
LARRVCGLSWRRGVGRAAPLAVALSLGLLVGATSSTVSAGDPPTALAALGKKVFFDPSLSASGLMSCATCHDPSHAYGPPDGRAVRRGGKDLKTPGVRAVPSLRYTLNRTPSFSHEYQSSAIERIVEVESVPTGGFAWDGRYDTLHEQAAEPLLAAAEMANADLATVAKKLARAPYAGELRAVFGEAVFDDAAGAARKALLAVERFELEDPSFHPFTSKFDAYLDGKAALSQAEARGLRWFSDPRKGNCGACHRVTVGADGSHPILTDFTFAAPAVPRNGEIPADADPAYFDLGLCGPLRQDKKGDPKGCGLFKTPTLRNVASRKVFFHNGRFHTLREAVRFYVERDLHPERFYPRRGGVVVLYDDLPPSLRGNADHLDPPFSHLEGAPPALTDAEVDDVLAFLATLTDADVEVARP